MPPKKRKLSLVPGACLLHERTVVEACRAYPEKGEGVYDW